MSVSEDGAKPKKRGCGGCLLAVVVVFILLIVMVKLPYIMYSAQSQVERSTATLEWPTNDLADMLPVPTTTNGKVVSYTSHGFDFDLYNCTQADFDAYVQACKEAGFVNDAEPTNSSYKAFNDDGYRLYTYYSASFGRNEISVSLDAPMEIGPVTWPTRGIAAQVPAPNLTTGNVQTDSTEEYHAYFSIQDNEDVEAYIDTLIAAGFDQNYSHTKNEYSATNADGVKVQVWRSSHYYRMMEVTISLPEEEEAEPAAALIGGSVPAGQTADES